MTACTDPQSFLTELKLGGNDLDQPLWPADHGVGISDEAKSVEWTLELCHEDKGGDGDEGHRGTKDQVLIHPHK